MPASTNQRGAIAFGTIFISAAFIILGFELRDVYIEKGAGHVMFMLLACGMMLAGGIALNRAYVFEFILAIKEILAIKGWPGGMRSYDPPSVPTVDPPPSVQTKEWPQRQEQDSPTKNP